MKTEKTIAFISILSLQLSGIEASNYSCSVNDSNGNIYDISSLKKEGGYVIRDIYDSTDSIFQTYFKFNFCEGMKTSCTNPAEVGAYHETTYKGQAIGACTNLGGIDKAKLEISEVQKKLAVNVTYVNGDYCPMTEGNEIVEKQMQITFLIFCGSDTNSKWSQVEYNQKDVTECTPRYEIYHPAGCHVVTEVNKYWRTVELFLLLFILYLAVGYIFNVRYNGKSGFEALPSLGSGLQAIVKFFTKTSQKLWKSTGKRQPKFSSNPVNYEFI